MRRTVPVILLALVLGAGAAQAKGIGAGAFAGLSIPFLQDVNTSSFSPSDAFGPTGSQFGLRAALQGVIPVVTPEVYFAKSSYGETEETFNGLTYTREGLDGTSFGLNALLGRATGPGMSFYPFVGLATYNLDRSGTDISEVGYNFGVGLGFSASPQINVHIRGEFNMVPTGDTSRKFTGANVGIYYDLYQIP